MCDTPLGQLLMVRGYCCVLLMGIKNLIKLIKKFAPAAITEVSHDVLKGKSLAIDANIMLYQVMYGNNDSKNQHIYGFMSRVTWMLSLGVTPVFVFDGKPPPLKIKCLQKRREREASIKKKIEEQEQELLLTGDYDALINVNALKNQLIQITNEHREDCKEFLRIAGIPVVTSVSEGEAACAYLNAQGKVDGVVSEDMDSLTFGAKVLYRGFTPSKNKVVRIDLDPILKGFGVTMDQFIDICILSGSDFCDTIGQVGPINAYKFVKEYGDIEGVVGFVEHKRKYTVPEEFEYEETREIFKSLVTEVEDVPLRLTDSSEAELRELLEMKHGIDMKKIDWFCNRLYGLGNRVYEPPVEQLSVLDLSEVLGPKSEPKDFDAMSINTSVSEATTIATVVSDMQEPVPLNRLEASAVIDDSAYELDGFGVDPENLEESSK